jgi:serine/threonine-protein kinase
MRSANDIHPGAIVAGKYRVRAILGRNHGLTIDAFHTSFDQRAIIKLLLPNQAAVQEVERFRRESRALSKLASEHVARILDAGSEPDGSVYLIRQYIDGTDLEKHVRRVGPLPITDAILYVLQASEAVAEAHANSIVVRDLEPSHLFLTQRTGGAPLVKLADFGTAKLVSAAPEGGGSVEITGTAMFGLTPYASPELIGKARDVDARTDVWSLGAVLYELLAGRAPFQGEAAALMLQITREAPQPLALVRSDVPVELENAIGWALAKDPDARFRNVHAFAHALLPFAPPEGHLLVERIGQITSTDKEKKSRGSEPPPSLPPMAAPPPRTGSTPGSSPGAWVHPDAARLPAVFANLPVVDDAETCIIPG